MLEEIHWQLKEKERKCHKNNMRPNIIIDNDI